MLKTLTFSCASILFLAGCERGPVGNTQVPAPRAPVELSRYMGKWYEIARYENRFETGCEAVTAEYAALPDGKISVRNTCHRGAVEGPTETVTGKAKIVESSGNAKLSVSFFGPFYVGDYWVLDHAANYRWSIVGEPSGRYLWLLAREPHPTPALIEMLKRKAQSMGYDVSLLRPVRQ